MRNRTNVRWRKAISFVLKAFLGDGRERPPSQAANGILNNKVSLLASSLDTLPQWMTLVWSKKGDRGSEKIKRNEKKERRGEKEKEKSECRYRKGTMAQRGRWNKGFEQSISRSSFSKVSEII
ncbi:hypothetical protein AVEN_202920-1 [Araneus ventricosus]|uniref:Uncharacterized protein n=1 Tax=Araneus ventricosus TaxID=182803 RepID=A0A4Y2K876_ARAVE|nr:hypothetical protein AVEN_202920-1 [Araneus ventricosus]